MAWKIILFLLLGLEFFAQELPSEEDYWFPWGIGRKSYTGSWLPENLRVDTTETIASFIGQAPRTKVDKDSGGVSVRPYMRVWSDSINVVEDSGFDVSDTWVKNGNVTISAGAVHYDDLNLGYLRDTLSSIAGKVYELQFTVSNTTGLILTFYQWDYIVPVNYGLISAATTYTNGVYKIKYTCLENYEGIDIRFSVDGSTGDLDDLIIQQVADSSYGYVYNHTRPSDTSTYYMSQSVGWRKRDKSWVWLAAETDTITIYPYVEPSVPGGTNYLVDKEGGKILMAGRTYAIKFKD